MYAYGGLNWTSLSGLQSSGSILWMPVVVSFALVAGTSLDYDIFVLTRILYERCDAATMRDAIVRGLWRTGSIITSAGIIMSIAFCSLLFSHSNAMNLLSYYTVTAVLFDTFIVRTLVVPALFSLMPDMSCLCCCCSRRKPDAVAMVNEEMDELID